MKFLIIALLISFQVFAGEQTDADKKAQALLEEITTISEKKLDPKTDIATVKKALKNLIELDKYDPSRTGVAMMAGSYSDNEALYKKAAKQIETPKNKKSLKEILGMLKKLSTSGNG